MIKYLSIIIPARNEQYNLTKIIPVLFTMYDKNIIEIIVVNDNSTDNTRKVLYLLKKIYSRLKIINRYDNPGVGNALKTAINKLSPKSKFALFMDCDFLINIADIAKFMKVIPDFDGVIGSRFISKNSLQNYPGTKLIANRLYHVLAKLLFQIPQSDLTNNFKLYKRELVDILHPYLTSCDFAINAEIGYYPVLWGARIGQVAVKWQEREGQMGLSKFKILRVGPSYLRVLIRLILMSLNILPTPNITNISVIDKATK